MAKLTIGRAAEAAGVRIATIRFYERKGLIDQPVKPGTGYRTYPAETVQRIRFIRQAQDIGFSLQEIADLLSLRADPGADCSDIRERASAKRDEVNRKIDQLVRIRGALEELIAVCPGQGALPACSILGALDDGESRQAERSNRKRRKQRHA